MNTTDNAFRKIKGEKKENLKFKTIRKIWEKVKTIWKKAIYDRQRRSNILCQASLKKKTKERNLKKYS